MIAIYAHTNLETALSANPNSNWDNISKKTVINPTKIEYIQERTDAKYGTYLMIRTVSGSTLYTKMELFDLLGAIQEDTHE